MRQTLLHLLRTRSFKRGDFSGDYYLDVRTTSMHSQGSLLIGEAFYAIMKDFEFDGIGGLEIGAVPIVTASVITWSLYDTRPKEGFWVQACLETKRLLEGNVTIGDRVFIVDDVITRGTSTMRAIDAARNFGCRVVGVIGLVDRLAGGRELFELEKIPFHSIFTIKDFLS